MTRFLVSFYSVVFQIATIFARLSANGYNEALIAQGAISCLLSLLQIQAPTRHRDLSKRIKYKAAICLGTIASTGYGLKSINSNQGALFSEYYEVSRIIFPRV